MEDRIPNKSFIVMLVIMMFSWFLAMITLSFVFPDSSWFLSLPSFFMQIIFAAVLIGFLIYHQRFRDERSISISDKSTRNGFAFVFYVVPIAIVALSATDISTDALLALVLVWVGAVAFACISALYYYKK